MIFSTKLVRNESGVGLLQAMIVGVIVALIAAWLSDFLVGYNRSSMRMINRNLNLTSGEILVDVTNDQNLLNSAATTLSINPNPAPGAAIQYE